MDDEAPDPSPPARPAGPFLALLGGGAAVIVSGFLGWIERENRFSSFGSSEVETAGDIDIQFLWDTIPAGTGPKLVLLLVALGVVAVVAGLGSRSAPGLVAGVATVLVVVALFLRLGAQLREFDDDSSAFGSLQAGPYLALAGGISAIVGSRLLPRRTQS